MKKRLIKILKNFKKTYIFLITSFFLLVILFIALSYLVLNFKTREYLTKIDNKIFYNQFSIVEIGDSLLNQFDFIRLFKRIVGKNPDIIDIELSPLDLQYFQSQKKKFEIKSWMPNSEKEWRKAKIVIDGKKINMKIKLHGASTTNLKKNHLSFKIKHKKEGPYFGLWRQYNLLSYYGSWGKTSTIATNNLAKDFGLIVSPQKTAILKINGVYYDLFRVEESFSKPHLLERNYKLPNFTIIKTNDNFDRKFFGETSNLELEEKFYMIDSGSSEALNPIAMSALKELLMAIKNKDTIKIKELIDLDYYAKFFAFISLYNYVEYGSDMKLLFDHDKGKFKIIFRAEEILIKEYSPINTLVEFNTKLIEEVNSGTLEIFKILLSDDFFVKRRDEYLLNIVNNKEKFFNIVDKTYSENNKNIIFSNEPRSREKYLKNKTKETIKNNINIISEYLSYGRFYISEELLTDNKNKVYEVLSDTFIDHYIDGYYKKNNSFVLFEKPIFLKKIEDFFKIKMGVIYNYQINKFLIDDIDFKNFRIINSLTQKKVNKEMIFIEKFKSIEKDIDFKKILKKNKIKFTLIQNDLYILEETYFLQDNLIFPENLNVYFNPGVNFILDRNISIVVRGSFYAKGKKDKKIYIKSKNHEQKQHAFNSIILIGDNFNDTVKLENFEISGGSSDNILFIKTTSQMHINNYKNVEIKNSLFSNSYADDGLNIKNSTVIVERSIFKDNSADQLDCDNCSGLIKNSYFSPNNNSTNKNGDGLDLSFADLLVIENIFEKNLDKGISVGENSSVKIINNKIINNNIGIAAKDGSKVYIKNNIFLENVNNLLKYNKKIYYSNPSFIKN